MLNPVRTRWITLRMTINTSCKPETIIDEYANKRVRHQPFCSPNAIALGKQTEIMHDFSLRQIDRQKDRHADVMYM